MKRLPRIFVSVLAVALFGCAAPPAPEPVERETAAEQPSSSVADTATAKADALLADMKRREAAFKEFERSMPPPPPPPRLEDFAPRQEPAAPRAMAISSNQPTSSGPSQALESPAAAQSEETWKNRMRDLKARLDAAELSLASARAQVSDLQRYVREDGSMPPVVADNMFRARASVTDAAAATVFAQTQIKNLEEEARRAGIPSGWLRP